MIFKQVFHKSPKIFYIRNYVYIGLFITSLFLMDFLKGMFENPIIGILVNGIISVGVSIGLILAVTLADTRFRYELGSIIRTVKIFCVKRKKSPIW